MSEIVGDNYKKVIFNVTKEKMDFETHGLDLVRKDYYQYLRTFCITFRFKMGAWLLLHFTFTYYLGKTTILLVLAN